MARRKVTIATVRTTRALPSLTDVIPAGSPALISAEELERGFEVLLLQVWTGNGWTRLMTDAWVLDDFVHDLRLDNL